MPSCTPRPRSHRLHAAPVRAGPRCAALSWQWLSADKQHHRPLARIGVLDRRPDQAYVGVGLDHMVCNPHGIQNRAGDAYAVMFGLPRRHTWLLVEQPGHHADRQGVLDAYRADRVDRIEQSRVLHEQERALVAIGQAGADADAFVFLANADQPQARLVRERAQEALAGMDVGKTRNELDAARLDLIDDPATMQDAGARSRRRGDIELHALSSPGAADPVSWIKQLPSPTCITHSLRKGGMQFPENAPRDLCTRAQRRASAAESRCVPAAPGSPRPPGPRPVCRPARIPTRSCSPRLAARRPAAE